MSNLQHKKKLLRGVKRNSNGGATVSWMDLYFNPDSGTYVKHADERTSNEPIHEDFKSAFRPFAEHYLIFTELVSEPKATHPFDGSTKGVDRLHIGSIILSGGNVDESGADDDKPIGVQIHGTRRLKCGRVVNALAPAIKLGAPQEKYKFSAEVDAHLQVLEAEAWQYLEGKCAPPAQAALQFGDAEGLEEVGEEEGAKLLGEAR